MSPVANILLSLKPNLEQVRPALTLLVILGPVFLVRPLLVDGQLGALMGLAQAGLSGSTAIVIPLPSLAEGLTVLAELRHQA